MATAQPLSGRSKVAFLVVLLVPLMFVLVQAHRAGTVETVNAEVTVLPDGRTVQSVFTTNPCGHALRLDITETSSEVRVRTLIRQDSGFPGGCNDNGIIRRLEATLDVPLGTRALVAAS
jgi:hypothetical protein